MIDFAEQVAIDILPDFGSDLHLRNRYFIPESKSHPAREHLGLLHYLVEKYTHPGDTIADCMCGSGSILYAATLQRNVIAREIEPRWLEITYRNVAHMYQQTGLFASFVGQMNVGSHDACEPWDYQADCVLFSPPYGNAASSSPLAHRALRYKQLPGKRWKSLLTHVESQQGSWGSVMFHYGTHPAQIGHFRGKRYYAAMTRIYANAYECLPSGGLLILILKDHILHGKRVETTLATVALCEGLGFVLVAHHQRTLSQLSLWQRRRKEAGLAVVEEEDVVVFRKEERNRP